MEYLVERWTTHGGGWSWGGGKHGEEWKGEGGGGEDGEMKETKVRSGL